MVLGYARFRNTKSEDASASLRALKDFGVSKIYEDKSGKGRWDKPQLEKLLKRLGTGDTLVVYRLEDLSRSLKDFLAIIEKVHCKGAAFVSLQEEIDTNTPGGNQLMDLLVRFSQFDKDMVRERVKGGVRKAKEEGRYQGRPSKFSLEEQASFVRQVESGEKTVAEIAREHRVHSSTISRILAKARVLGVGD